MHGHMDVKFVFNLSCSSSLCDNEQKLCEYTLKKPRIFKSFLHGLPRPEDEGPTMLRNVGDYPSTRRNIQEDLTIHPQTQKRRILLIISANRD